MHNYYYLLSVIDEKFLLSDKFFKGKMQNISLFIFILLHHSPVNDERLGQQGYKIYYTFGIYCLTVSLRHTYHFYMLKREFMYVNSFSKRSSHSKFKCQKKNDDQRQAWVVINTRCSPITNSIDYFLCWNNYMTIIEQKRFLE